MSIAPISPELAAKAAAEINEKPERIQEDIAHIKEWLRKQPHLNARMDDQFILAFLRGTKYSLERCKEKLDMYYTLRSLSPEFYKNRDPFAPEMQEILKLGSFLPLPSSPTSTAPRVVLVRAVANPEKYKIEELLKFNTMMADIGLLEDHAALIAGSQMIQDMKGATLAHFAISPALMKRIMTIFQDGYPMRPKGFFYLHPPSFFERVFSLFKSVLKEKFLKRIYMPKNEDELFEMIPRDIMPKEYGGDGPTMAELGEYWKKKVESYAEWFKEDEQYGSDETKRPGKPKTAGELFGVEGSFRKLEVD